MRLPGKRWAAALLAAALLVTGTGCGAAAGPDTSADTAGSVSGRPAGQTAQQPEPGEETYTIAQNGYAISTASEYATLAGAAVLEAGGNAVDAAVAASYTLAVTEPYASGPGGGGGMLVYDPDTEDFSFLNYLSMSAPSGARSKNIAVPGFVSGMQTALDHWGTMDLGDLLTYAIDCAENGFSVNSELAYRSAYYSSSGALSQSMPQYGLSEGDTLVQTELADTLRTLAAEGSEAFYTGSIARKICAATRLTPEDLAAYETELVNPVVTTLNGDTLASAPAPFSGVTLLQMLKLFDLLDVPDPAEDPAAFVSQMVSVKEAAGAVRAHSVCDLTYHGSELDYDEMLSDSYLFGLMGDSVEGYEDDTESEDTTHLSVVDANGMAVSVTNTLSQFWGSKVSAAGFFLNNTLQNFSSGVNDYAAGKRPRTFIAPAIVRGADGSILAIGTPGGNVIVNVLAVVLADVLLYGTPLEDAILKQRLVASDGNTLLVETGLDYDPVADPAGLGYYLVRSSSNRKFGCVNAAGWDPNAGWYAVADPRRLGYGVAVNEN